MNPVRLRANAIASYHQEWMAKWEVERKQLAADQSLWLLPPGGGIAAASVAVDDWNTATGDTRSLEAFMAELDTPDLADREMMTPAWLHLYCYTLWHWYAT